jgi:hypothetical protein
MLVPLIVGITLAFIVGLLTIPFMQHLFGLGTLSWKMISICIGAAFVGTFWMELVKALYHRER